MNERAKITASHLSRQAIVYLRQSSAAQVEHNRESTDRQYALAAKARELGWPNDRITAGQKGPVSEPELAVLRARLNGGIRNKAARGELRRGLPVGFVWGEADGEVRFHPDEAIVTAVRNVFARFAETGSARRVW